MRLVTFVALLVLVLTLFACSSSNEQLPPASAPTQSTAAPDAAFTTNGVDVLARSGREFSSTDVTSFSGTYAISSSADGTSDKTTTDFAMQLPNAYYSKTTSQGADAVAQYGSDPSASEQIFRDGAMYMSSSDPPVWISWPATITGINADYIRKTAAGTEEDWLPDLLDYSGAIAKAANVQFIGIEDIDGQETAHYTLDIRLNDFYLIIAPKCSIPCNAESNAQQQGINFTIKTDAWIGTSDYLPYKFVTSAQIDSPEHHGNISATATYANYNKPVNVPDAPANATPCLSLPDPSGCLI